MLESVQQANYDEPYRSEAIASICSHMAGTYVMLCRNFKIGEGRFSELKEATLEIKTHIVPVEFPDDIPWWNQEIKLVGPPLWQ